MSYVRFGEHSSVYVIGTIERGDCGPENSVYGNAEKHLAECCGCILIPRDSEGHFTAPFPQFGTREGILDHLREHQAAGHKVPESVFRRIGEDDWLTGKGGGDA